MSERVYSGFSEWLSNIEAEAREQGAQAERERLRADDHAWWEAGFLDAYLNIAGVKDEAEASAMLRRDIDYLLSDPQPEDPET